MEQENKDLIFHFEDEEQVARRVFSFLNITTLNKDSMKFAHNGKVYELDRKVADLDADSLCVDFYLKLCKP